MKEPALDGGVLKSLLVKAKASFCNRYYTFFKFNMEGRELEVTKAYSLGSEGFL